MTIEQRARWVLLGAILLSLLVHGGASVALALLPTPQDMLAALQHEIIEFEMREEALPPPVEAESEPEAPTPEEEVPPTPAEQTPPPPRDPNTPPPPETAEPPAPLAEQVHDFGGQAITGTGNWAISAVGSGQDTSGPQGHQLARSTGRQVTGNPDGVVGGTGTAPAAPAPINYTRRPAQPAGMNGLLQRFYPTGARARGVEGRARVMIRILPDGGLDVQRVVSESPAGEGFGQACMQSLRSSPTWTTALDENGNAVAVQRPFDCVFRQQ